MAKKSLSSRKSGRSSTGAKGSPQGTATARKARTRAGSAAGARRSRRPAAARNTPKRSATKVHGRAAGAPQMIAALTVRDAEAAIAFYRKAFGFELAFTMPGADGRIAYAQMTFHDGRIMFSPEGANGGQALAPASSGREGPMQQYVYCPDVDHLTERARRAGATVLSEPTIMFWGDRMATLVDPDGYRWAFATNVADFDFTQVPDLGFAVQT